MKKTLILKKALVIQGFFFLLNTNLVYADEARPDYFYLPPGSTNVSDITHERYTQTLMNFQFRVSENVRLEKKVPLIVVNEWESPYFAGFAAQKSEHFEIHLWGGLARAPGATLAILEASLCHELGHIIGGEPYQTIEGAEWVSAEGQADFYAASICLPKFLDYSPEKIIETGLALIQFFQKYSYHEFSPVSVSTPATASEKNIINSYPSDQCRLDTFVAGANCQTAGNVCRPPACWKPQ